MFTPARSVGRGLSRVPFTSTPMPSLEAVPNRDSDLPGIRNSDASINLIADIAKQIGQSIGENIVSCLESKAISSGTGSSVIGETCNPRSVDISNLSLVLKSDVREPVYFRGDGSEKCTVHEWVEMMGIYLRKRGVAAVNQAEEVMCRLMGKARDIVKAGLRSNLSVDLSGGPAPIFDMLKQHFSDTAFSSMPLADFYATLPLSGEKPFDYWLRLNRAMEITEDCLRQQNKKVDDPSRDLTDMFIRHCPDPELSLVFKCKPLQQWSAAEVKERLDEYWREQRHSSLTKHASVVTTLKQEVSPSMPLPEPVAKPAPMSSLPQSSQGAAEPFERILALLERVLEQKPQQSGSNQEFLGGQRNKVKSWAPCAVCGGAGHTTQFHCRTNHLCFLCHATGHRRAECPRAMTLEPVSAAATTATTPLSGNEQAHT